MLCGVRVLAATARDDISRTLPGVQAVKTTAPGLDPGVSSPGSCPTPLPDCPGPPVAPANTATGAFILPEPLLFVWR
jgi:hypothetical protein